MRTLAALLVVLASGCHLYESNDAPMETDAGLTCEPSPDRNTSCRNICRVDVELCTGADWTVCLEECRTGEAFVAWCPGQRCVCAPEWPTCPPGCEPPSY